MTTGKQVFLYVALLSAYSSFSICMEKQEPVERVSVEQKLNFNAFPLNVQEQIIGYLQPDNLYRALWSRSHNASPEFYNDIVIAYLESHFVPQELVDKTIAKNFAHFHGSEKQKQEFQEKIKRALRCVGSNDIDLFKTYQQIITLNKLSLPKDIKNKVSATNDELMRQLHRLRKNGELTRYKKKLQKYCSCLTWCKVFLSSKTVLKDTLYRVNVWIVRSNIKKHIRVLGCPALILSFMYHFIHTPHASNAHDIQTQLIELINYPVGKVKNSALTIFAMLVFAYVIEKIASYTMPHGYLFFKRLRRVDCV